MRSPVLVTLAQLTALLSVGGCASGPAVTAPEVPANLRPPAGQVLFLEALAAGVQIYECASKPDQPSSYEWAFRAPEASLTDPAGRHIGKHFAGPTWASTDGSSVVGEVKARDPGPNPSAIPWLLLSAKSNAGAGVLSKTTSVQRVTTVGESRPLDRVAP